MKTKIAVIISDIHFNLQNLPLSSCALRKAFQLAEEYEVPLVVAGDLNDTKAIIRGECLNAIIDIYSEFNNVKSFTLVGNHDKLNEKGIEHSLNFIDPYTNVIHHPFYSNKLKCIMIPYISNKEQFINYINETKKISNRFIIHQGIQGALMGDYIVDNSAVDKHLFDNCKVISGHYHKHQTVGNVTYVGSPFTMSFGEANDGPKGVLILYDDFSFEHVPFDLRKHVVVNRICSDAYNPINNLRQQDKVWFKVNGSKEELDKITKKEIAEKVIRHENFRLDKICTDIDAVKPNIQKLTEHEILDKVINDSNRSEEDKIYLKSLWRELLNEKT